MSPWAVSQMCTYHLSRHTEQYLSWKVIYVLWPCAIWWVLPSSQVTDGVSICSVARACAPPRGVGRCCRRPESVWSTAAQAPRDGRLGRVGLRHDLLRPRAECGQSGAARRMARAAAAPSCVSRPPAACLGCFLQACHCDPVSGCKERGKPNIEIRLLISFHINVF